VKIGEAVHHDVCFDGSRDNIPRGDGQALESKSDAKTWISGRPDRGARLLQKQQGWRSNKLFAVWRRRQPKPGLSSRWFIPTMLAIALLCQHLERFWTAKERRYRDQEIREEV